MGPDLRETALRDLDLLPLGTYTEHFDPRAPEALRAYVRRRMPEMGPQMSVAWLGGCGGASPGSWVGVHTRKWRTWIIHFEVCRPYDRKPWRYVRAVIQQKSQYWVVQEGRVRSEPEEQLLRDALTEVCRKIAGLVEVEAKMEATLRSVHTEDNEVRPTAWARVGTLV